MSFITTGKNSKPGSLGGKGAALAALEDFNARIPPWFAVTPHAFGHSVSRAETSASMLPSDEEVARLLSPDMALHSDVLHELHAALAALCENGEPVAVRSSASDEDGEVHSFAGQFHSFLYVAHEDVPARILDVWRSGFSESIIAYRRRKGLPAHSGIPSVLIQHMVDADVSGVAFSANPVNGDSKVAMVASVYGLASALVSGDNVGDTHRVDRCGKIITSDIAVKTSALRAPDTGHTGLRSVEVDAERAQEPALSDEQVRAVVELARNLEQRFGCPQDIEWAIEDRELYLLQSRPITARSRENEDAEGALNVWDNSNIIESYNGVTTPLTFSFASYVYEQVYEQFCRLLRVPESRIANNADVFRNMLGFIQGRIYYNILNWYRILAMLPGFQANRVFMEQMMGIRDAIPDELLPENEALGPWTRLKDNLSLLRSAGALVLHHFRLGASIARFYARLDHALSVPREEIATYTPVQLLGIYEDVEGQLLKRWDAPLINDFLAMIFFGLLRELSEKWLGYRTLANDLLRGQEGIISVEPARRLAAMARTAAGDPEFVETLCEATVDDIRKHLEAHPKHDTAFNEYLDAFGDRCLEELKLESPTLLDDPLLLYRSVGQLAKGPKARSESLKLESKKDEVCAQAEQVIKDQLGSAFIRRALFNFVLRHARNRIRDRENLRFARTRLFASVRHIFLVFGKRFYDTGAIDSPSDVFFLERPEVFAFVEGRSTTTNLRGLIEVRKREFAEHKAASAPPNRMMTRGIVGAATILSAGNELSNDDSNESREGIGCSAGVVSGPARVILDPRNERLEEGEILVAKSTDPGWILVFSAASGLLIERGSLLSHSAIVAREMGIPCVVSVSGLTDWIKTGDLIEFDGSTGVVRRLAEQGAAHG